MKNATEFKIIRAPTKPPGGQVGGEEDGVLFTTELLVAGGALELCHGAV